MVGLKALTDLVEGPAQSRVTDSTVTSDRHLPGFDATIKIPLRTKTANVDKGPHHPVLVYFPSVSLVFALRTGHPGASISTKDIDLMIGN